VGDLSQQDSPSPPLETMIVNSIPKVEQELVEEDEVCAPKLKASQTNIYEKKKEILKPSEARMTYPN